MVVVPDGVIPEAGCLVELIRAVRNNADVDMAVARLVAEDGSVIEAGVHLWKDLEVRAIGAGGDRDDPRWRAQRDVDGAVLAPYAIRRDVATSGPRGVLELGLAVQASGRRVVCPAAAWARGPLPGAEAPARLGPDMAARYPKVVTGREAAGTADGWLGPRPSGARVLVCDRWLPRPDHHAGEKRVADLLIALRSLGCTVTLAALSGLRRQPYAEDYEAMGIEVFVPGIEMVDPLGILAALAVDRSGLYDVVIVPWPELFDRCHVAVRRCFPRATLVYDVIDLHHVRLAQQRTLSGDVDEAEIERYRRMEMDAARSCDVAFVVNEREGDVLQELVPGCTVHLVPLVNELSPGAPLAQRQGLLYVGGFGHPPNVDAVHWFVDEILPRVREHVPAVLTVVGPDPPPSIAGLDDGEAVRVVGHVVNIDDYYDRSRVFVSPLRFGAGVKGKNVQALARGLPLVTTAVGAAGLRITGGADAFVEDDPEGFARAVVTLMGDDGAWSRLAIAGMEVARRDHSMANLEGALSTILTSALRTSRQ
jgi:glycosyltransferase involved in cell wall biosynthesis